MVVSRQEWLQGLSVGDSFMTTTCGFHGSNYTIYKVVKLTKTLIRTDVGTSFRRSDGICPSRSVTPYSPPLYAKPIDKDLIFSISEEKRKRKACHILHNTKWSDYPLDTLTEVLKVLRKGEDNV